MISWLEDSFSPVSPAAFYRDLFPLGCLDKRGAMTKGKYTGVCVQIEGRKAKRYTITDELDNLEELLSSDTFTVISPAAYAGKTQSGEMQRLYFALAIDLDNTIIENGRPVGIESLFSQIERAEIIPRPTYVVASSKRNVHLYYLFESPIPAFQKNKDSLTSYKTWLTRGLWNKYITEDYESPQIESLMQPMRAVGSICKNPEDGRVRAFLTGDKVTIDYLNSFAPKEEQIVLSDSPKGEGKKAVKNRRAFYFSESVYHWWLRQIKEKVQVGRRYFSCWAAGAYAQKCGIEREVLEQDILALVPYLDSLSVSENNRFTVDDAMKAICSYDDKKLQFMRRETIERISGIAIPKNKRRGKKQKEHLARIRHMQNYDDPEGNWRNKNGAPTKKELVISYYKEHPSASVRDVASALEISITTAQKWMKYYREQEQG